MNLDQVIEGAMDELMDNHQHRFGDDLGVRFELPRPSVPVPQPVTCVVHGLHCRHGRVGDEYHIHYTGKLTGRHFNHIVVKDFDHIPQTQRDFLLGHLQTRLRAGGSITVETTERSAATAAEPALPEMCCGGVGIRAVCPYHGPGAK